MGMVSDIIANGRPQADLRLPLDGCSPSSASRSWDGSCGATTCFHERHEPDPSGRRFMVSTLLHRGGPRRSRLFNWLGTMWRGNLRFHVPMLNAIGFVSMFTIGGLSGIFMAATPVDIPLPRHPVHRGATSTTCCLAARCFALFRGDPLLVSQDVRPG